MSSEIPKLYKQVKTTMKDSIESASSVVLTSVMWTARTTEAYLTVSGHFIEQNWQMQACSLETVRVSVQHTSRQYIPELLTNISDDWGITSKVHAVVTNNGANLVLAAQKTPLEAHSLFFTHPQLSREGLH